MLKKGYVIIRTRDGWSFGPRAKEIEGEKNPHMDCEHFEDYKNTLFNLAKLSYRLAVLEMKNDLVELQLDYALKKGDSMIGMMRTLYLEKLAKKRGNKDKITRSRSFVLYESLLEDIVQYRVYVILKNLFKKHSLAEMSESEFRIEKEDSVKSIMQKITEIIDKKYLFNNTIPGIIL